MIRGTGVERSPPPGTGLLTEDARRNACWKADLSIVKPTIIRLEASALPTGKS